MVNVENANGQLGEVAGASGAKRECEYMVICNKNDEAVSAAVGKVKAAAIVKKYKKNATRRKLFNWKRRGSAGKSNGKSKSSTNSNNDKADVEETTDATSQGDEVTGDDGEVTGEDGEVTGEEGEEQLEQDVELPEPPKLEIDSDELNKLLADAVAMSRDYSLVALERLYVEMEAILSRYSASWDRKDMVSEIRRNLRITRSSSKVVFD